jgi:hypothetical protein
MDYAPPRWDVVVVHAGSVRGRTMSNFEVRPAILLLSFNPIPIRAAFRGDRNYDRTNLKLIWSPRYEKNRSHHPPL